MPRLLIAPSFPGFFEGSVAELCDFFLIKSESAVPVERFSISSNGRYVESPVEPGKYQTALFLLYGAVISHQPNYVFDAKLKSLLPAYFGPRIVEAARHPNTSHIALHLLLDGYVRVNLVLKPGYELPETKGRTVHELIPFGWSQHDELDWDTPVPLVRSALKNFLEAVTRGTMPVADTLDPNIWPSRIWVERAELLWNRLGNSLSVSA